VRAIEVRGARIELGALLKLAGLADTGGQAKRLVQGGAVRVNGALEVRRRRKLGDGDIVEVEGRGAVVVRGS
jgi:ribosome-associated protein